MQDVLDVDRKELVAALSSFIRRICEIYPSERIVLLDIVWLWEYHTKNGWNSYPGEERWKEVNQLLRELLTQAEKELPKSLVIRMPEHLYCDPEHKWGKSVRNYCAEYYEYALKAFHVVTDHTVKDKQEKLNRLYVEYSNLFALKRKAFESTGQE